MRNALVRLLGWRALLLHGDPAVVDRWRWLRKQLAPGPVRTLDAGTGNGAFALYSATLGNDVVGISFDERAIEMARERTRTTGISTVDFVCGDLRQLETLTPRLGEFDQIICCETLEHIRDDRKVVSDLATLLRPGGRMLVTTPYKHYRPLVGDMVSQHEDGGHVRWGYTRDEMKSLMEGAGLYLVETDYVSGIVTQALINLGRTLQRRMPLALAWLLVLPLRLLQPLDWPLTALCRYPYLSIAFTAQRR
jgi:SAM-dependent methyltransferase